MGSKRKELANDPDLKARRVFVGNLSFKTHWQRVREHMRRAGNVIRVDIFSNKDGRSKGCGYFVCIEILMAIKVWWSILL